MDYEKKYKEALERARKLQENSNGMILKKWLWNIFPELAESEDEKIRKELLNAFQESEDSLYMVLTPHRRESFIAWLEKQGKEKPIAGDTLKVKEVKKFIWNNARTTVPEDNTNQIICIKEDGLAVSTIGKIVNGTVKWAYLDDLLNTNSFNIEVKEVDIEKELDEWMKYGPHTSYPWCTIPDAIKITAEYFFELGLKMQKGE